MKVGVLREKLEATIYKELYSINRSKELSKEVLNKLSEKGFLTGDAQQIIIGNTALEFIGEIKLGAVANAIHEVTKNKHIDIGLFYDDEEIKQIKELQLELDREKIKLPITFSNMTQYSHDMWVGIIPIQRFVKLHQNNISTYNFETQRDPSFKKYKGTIIRQVSINPRSVAEISRKILKATYLYDDITLNILANGEEDFEFKKTGKDVGDLIFKGGELNLTDGAHRLKGAESALLVNPSLKGNFILIITNFDIDKANAYIMQKDKRNPISKEYLESKDMENLNNEVVRNINESTVSDLRGLIATDDFLVRQGEALTQFATVSKAVSILWDLENRRDVRIVSDYLIDFLNEIVGIYPNELKNDIPNCRHMSLINHHNMIVYYLTIARILQGNKDWEEKLYNILKSTDFNENNPFWKDSILYFSYSNMSHRLPRVIKKLEKQVSKEVV